MAGMPCSGQAHRYGLLLNIVCVVQYRVLHCNVACCCVQYRVCVCVLGAWLCVSWLLLLRADLHGI